MSQMLTYYPAEIKCIEYYQNNVIKFIMFLSLIFDE